MRLGDCTAKDRLKEMAAGEGVFGGCEASEG